jgi:putative hydrolase of the HAD superfamily
VNRTGFRKAAETRIATPFCGELQFSFHFQVKTGSANDQNAHNGREFMRPPCLRVENLMPLQIQSPPFHTPADQSIKVVAFDAVGTVMYATPSVSAAYCGILEKLSGRTVDPDEVRAVLSRRLAARSGEGNLQTTEASERQFWFDLVAELVPDPDRQTACFEALFRHFAEPSNWRCYEDVAEALQALRSAGLQVVLASNFDQRLHAVCDGLAELSPVSARIISSEVGWRKPAPQFFEIVCQRTQCSPAEILFVGDDCHNDILGAQMAGMPTAWIDRRNEPPGAVEASVPPAANDPVWRINTLRELITLVAS